MIDSFNPPSNSIILCLESNKPIIVIDEIGFKYKGVLIEDAGDVYKLFKEFLRSAQNTEQEISDEQLKNILHTSGRYDTPYHKDSIMSYGKICEHDDGYLCEHRRKYIIDLFIKNK